MPEVADRPVLAGVDGSVESLAALDLAATEAGLRHARLLVTYAWAGPYWRPGRPGGVPVARPDAERLLAAATAWLRTHHPHVAVTGRLVLGDPVQVLTAGSVTAQLVVVGQRGNGLSALGWGSVAAQLSRRCKAPLIVRTFRPRVDEAPPDAPVVAAVSLESSGRTLRFAFEEAARYGVPLAPCYVWTQPAWPDAERALADQLAGWSRRYPQVVVRPQVRHGVDVAQTLAAAAHAARLLVVGAGPDKLLVEILHGSVSRGVLRTAACPVAVVPEPLPSPEAGPELVSAGVGAAGSRI